MAAGIPAPLSFIWDIPASFDLKRRLLHPNELAEILPLSHVITNNLSTQFQEAYMKKINQLALFIILLGSILFLSNCIVSNQAIQIQYTPLVQAEKLADPENPQSVFIHRFEDNRKNTKLISSHVSIVDFEETRLQVAGDLNTTVSNAVRDVMIKSGFRVPIKKSEAETPMLDISGEILAYYIESLKKWSSVQWIATVKLKLTITDPEGRQHMIISEGNNSIKGDSIGFDTAGPTLDKALQDCVVKLVRKDTFLKLVRTMP